MAVNQEKMVITISPGGETEVAVTGVKGKSCTDVSAGIEKALGKTTGDVKTAEYNESPRAASRKVAVL